MAPDKVLFFLHAVGPFEGQSQRINFFWEVLNGVGVDGVGVIFPFFYAFFPFFCAILPFFCTFLPFFYAFFPFFYAFFPFFYARGISLRPRLHRPRAELPDFSPRSAAGEYCENSSEDTVSFESKMRITKTRIPKRFFHVIH